MSRKSNVRYIKPETVSRGDVIRVTWKWRDTEKSVVGTVASIQHYTHSTEYETAEGEVLFTRWRVNPPFKLTIALLDRPSDRTPEMFELEPSNA